MMRMAVAIGALTVWIAISGEVRGAERSLSNADIETLSSARTLYVDVQSSTWMPRGRNFEDVGPTLRSRLAGVGFALVRDQSQPHDLTLKVNYREQRGQELTFQSFATDIACEVVLVHPSLGSVLEISIAATTAHPESGTPPYLDALFEFETNPYYFLLADLVKARVRSGADKTAGLIAGLARLSKIPAPSDAIGGGHSGTPNEILYAGQVRENVIAELGRLKDVRAVPALRSFLHHPSQRVRLRTLDALVEIGTTESRMAVEEAARHDKSPEVRQAASAALARRSKSSNAP